MTVTALWRRKRKNDWVKVTIARSHTRLKPAWREQGSTRWFHEDKDKFLVQRWHGEAGKFRVLVQRCPDMTNAERAVWNSPSHLAKARRFS